MGSSCRAAPARVAVFVTIARSRRWCRRLLTALARRSVAADHVCHVAEPWLTQVRGLTTYVVPKIDVQLAASFQFKPGTLGLGGNDSATQRHLGQANYAVTNAVAGNPLLNSQQSVNLLAPG